MMKHQNDEKEENNTEKRQSRYDQNEPPISFVFIFLVFYFRNGDNDAVRRSEFTGNEGVVMLRCLRDRRGMDVAAVIFGSVSIFSVCISEVGFIRGVFCYWQHTCRLVPDTAA